MLPTPNVFKLVAGSGESISPLNAFDQALLEAGAGNVNLLKVSSILPPRAVFDENISLPPGSLVPVAYGTLTSSKQGATIAAAVAVGIPEEGFGVIMEYSGYVSKKEAEDIITGMVKEAFQTRNLKLTECLVKAIEHRIIETGSVFAGVILWYD